MSSNVLLWFCILYFSDVFKCISLISLYCNHATSHITAHCLGGSGLHTNFPNTNIETKLKSKCFDQTANENTNIQILAPILWCTVEGYQLNILGNPETRTLICIKLVFAFFSICTCAHVCMYLRLWGILLVVTAGCWRVSSQCLRSGVCQHTSIQLTPSNHCTTSL